MILFRFNFKFRIFWMIGTISASRWHIIGKIETLKFYQFFLWWLFQFNFKFQMFMNDKLDQRQLLAQLWQDMRMNERLADRRGRKHWERSEWGSLELRRTTPVCRRRSTPRAVLLWNLGYFNDLYTSFTNICFANSLNK